MGFTYNEGRLFAYILGLKDPKFIAGYAGPEIDQALMRAKSMLGPPRLIRWRSGTRTGSKVTRWTFMRSLKSQGGQASPVQTASRAGELCPVG